MRRPLDAAKLHFVGCVHRAHRHRESDFEKLVRLPPIDLGVKLQPPRFRIQADDLPHSTAGADPAFHAHLRAQRRG